VYHQDPWSLGPSWPANGAGSSDKHTLPWLGQAGCLPSPLAPDAGTLPEVLQHGTPHRVPSQAEPRRATDTSEAREGESRHKISAFSRKPAKKKNHLKHK